MRVLDANAAFRVMAPFECAGFAYIFPALHSRCCWQAISGIGDRTLTKGECWIDTRARKPDIQGVQPSNGRFRKPSGNRVSGVALQRYFAYSI